MAHRLWLLGVLLALGTLLTITPQAPAQAQADGVNWLSLVPFENAPDGAPIADSLLDLRFSADAGAVWAYGDVRSGRYNAPYPLPCPTFGGPCAFVVTGNGFAWLGETPGVGRIDMLDPSVTTFGAGFSTAEPITVSAYSADGTVLGAQTVAPNLATGRLDPATLTAPAGRTIAYVLIRGAANSWIMDDLFIGGGPELPPRPLDPPAPLPTERAAEPAFVTVVQRAAPNLTAVPDSTVRLTIEVVNRGRGAARDAVLTLALNPDLLVLLNADFSHPHAWVSELTPSEVTIRTGTLPANTGLTIILELYVQPTAPLDAPLGGALQARWFDAAQGGISTANRTLLVAGTTNTATATLPLTVTPTAQPDTVTITAAFFAPLEPVGLWYDHGTGTVTALATLRAAADGRIDLPLDQSDLPLGGFFVAEGHWSGMRGVGTLTDKPES